MRIVRQGDQGYDDDRRVSNARFDYRPSLICYCDNESDVVDALRMARAGHYAVRVRSGGHQHEGMCSGDGVLVIDVSNMNRIELDVGKEEIRLGPGAKLGDVYAAVWKEGLLFPGGACGDVRVGGLVQGGGWGLFTRALGLTCDRLDRFRMVIPLLNARHEEDFHPIAVTTASNDPNADLHWAVCGGGGGNFGVATEAVFKVSPFRTEPGSRAEAVTQFTANWSDRDLLHDVLAEWIARFPGDDEFRLTTFCRLIAPGTEGTDKPALVSGNFVGAQHELTTILERLLPRTYAKADIDYKQVALWPPADTPGPSIFTHPQYQAGPPRPGEDLGSTCSGAYFRHKVSSCYPGPSFGSDAVKAIVDHVNRKPLAGARRYISLHSLGGVAKGDGSHDVRSCFAFRDKPFLMQYQAWWEAPGLDGVCLDWLATFRNDMRPYVEGAFINFPDRDLVTTSDRKTLLRQYYGKNFDRLMGVKQRYDPNDVFDFPMGIPRK